MKKKILFLVTKSNYGGAQRYVADLATALPRDQFDVVVAFGPAPEGGPGALAERLTEAGIRTTLVDALGRDINFADDWQAFRELVGCFSSERPDIVHLNSSKAGGLGALAARIARVPRIIFTVHGFPADENRSAFQKFLIHLATWLTLILAHHTILIATDAFERARRMPGVRRKISLVHNGITTPVFLPKNEARKELATLALDLPAGATWIGSVGELHPNKNYAVAIDALPSLPQEMHLVIIGGGEEREALLKRAQEKGVASRVHLLGYVPDAAKYLRAFDCFVLPSRKEGLPYVLLEAGYAYVPVIGSDIPGIRDVILPDFTGLRVPPDDAGALANAITRVLTDATLARSLSDELLKRVQKTFSRDTMLEKTLLVYTPDPRR